MADIYALTHDMQRIEAQAYMLMHLAPRSCAPWSAPSGAPRLVRTLCALPALPTRPLLPLPAAAAVAAVAVLVRLALADESSNALADLGVALGVPATQRGREYIAPAGRLGERAEREGAVRVARARRP